MDKELVHCRKTWSHAVAYYENGIYEGVYFSSEDKTLDEVKLLLSRNYSSVREIRELVLAGDSSSLKEKPHDLEKEEPVYILKTRDLKTLLKDYMLRGWAQHVFVYRDGLYYHYIDWEPVTETDF